MSRQARSQESQGSLQVSYRVLMPDHLECQETRECHQVSLQVSYQVLMPDHLVCQEIQECH